MDLGKAVIWICISRRGPITEENPRLAAIQASRSLESSSRTWFSTGMSNVALPGFILSQGLSWSCRQRLLCMLLLRGKRWFLQVINGQIYQGLISHRARWNTSLKEDLLSSRYYRRDPFLVVCQLYLHLRALGEIWSHPFEQCVRIDKKRGRS